MSLNSIAGHSRNRAQHSQREMTKSHSRFHKLLNMQKNIWIYAFARLKVCTPATNMVTKMSKPGKKRIMVQLWGTLAKAIDKNFRAMHIKRDGYLNDLFAREIENLAQEVTFRNADEVRKRLQERPFPDRVKLTLELDEQVVARIDEVLMEKNIPRDCFVNRVLFFLVAKESHFDYLGIEYDKESPATAKPIDDAKGFLYNPFSHIRSANENRFYTLAYFADGPFGKNGPNLFAMNTAITPDDWLIMNTSLDDLLGDLGIPSTEEAGHATN